MCDKKNCDGFNNNTEPKQLGESGFPPGITVDELWLFRRKRPSEHPSDNLKVEEGSFKALKSEYKRRFKNYYEFTERGRLIEISPIRVPKPEDTFRLQDDEEIESSENPRLTEYSPISRPHLVKTPTNLKLEGDFSSSTENASQFIKYLLLDRPPLLKTPTTLKLEGEMTSNTENRDKYIPFDLPPKPPLYKKKTNLHLEGSVETLTEKQEKYIRYEPQKRPPLAKKATNLHMEGELDFLPEYRRAYIEFKAERAKPALPVNNLKTDGFYDVVMGGYHPEIPNLRGGGDGEDLALKARLARTRESSPKIEETRNAYIDFGERSLKTRSRRGRHESLKSEGKMEMKPEYRAEFVDFPRRRPQIIRPEGQLLSEGERDYLTEKSEKYIPFPNVARTEPCKRIPELKLEGDIECQPEYRKAYIDYLIRERVERKARPLDNLGQAPKRLLEEEPLEKTLQPAPPKSPSKEAPRNRSLSQIETAVFGPKLAPPEEKKSASRRRSRTLPRSQTLKEAKPKTFGKPVLVENLASRCTTPVTLRDLTARNKWMRDSSVESNSAFVVLDKINGYWDSSVEY